MGRLGAVAVFRSLLLGKVADGLLRPLGTTGHSLGEMQ